jgi:arylsulfatase A-like enzyme
MGRQVQGQVRRRLGQVSRARLRPRQGQGLDSAERQLTPRPASMASWDSIPEDEKPFQRRLMEVFAGFTEHADYNAGRVIDEIERQGKLDNTLIFYIWGDNGSSAEGLNGTISEQLAQNGIRPRSRSTSRRWRNSAVSMPSAVRRPTTCITPAGPGRAARLTRAPSSWAPLRRHPPADGRLLAQAHQGGPDRAPAVPPRHRHRADDLRADEDHAAARVNGIEQDSIDGVSMVYAFGDAKAPGTRKTQFFDIMASRGIYHDGWFASAPGPREPWVGGMPKGIKEWSPLTDKWELYNLDEDWSQANDLAATNPQKLEEMKLLFLLESTKNKNLPIGGGLWSTAMFHPEDAPASALTNGPSRAP